MVSVMPGNLRTFGIGEFAAQSPDLFFVWAGDDDLGEEGGDVGETDDADLDDDWGLDTE